MEFMLSHISENFVKAFKIALYLAESIVYNLVFGLLKTVAWTAETLAAATGSIASSIRDRQS